MQNFGFAGKDNVIYIGTNGKMSEISAAMGLASFESYEDITSTNYNNYKFYKKIIKKLPGIRMISFNENEICNFQYIVLEIDEKITQISRDQIMQILHAENIIARRYFYPGCHRMEPYRSYQPYASFLVPKTEKLVGRILTLPTGTSISESHVHKIGQIIKFILDNAKAIRKNTNLINPKAVDKANIKVQSYAGISMQ
jgi:dTDP-4-amino-4,6-dideoxygalactose transaminase